MSPAPVLQAAKSAVLSWFARPAPAAAPLPAKSIEPRHVPPTRIGRGAVDGHHRAGIRRIVVTAEEELFERIRARAVGKRVPMAAEVRHLLELGLEAGGK